MDELNLTKAESKATYDDIKQAISAVQRGRLQW